MLSLYEKRKNIPVTHKICNYDSFCVMCNDLFECLYRRIKEFEHFSVYYKCGEDGKMEFVTFFKNTTFNNVLCENPDVTFRECIVKDEELKASVEYEV